MLFDTSKAKMTVPSRCGNPTLICGRANATTMMASAVNNSAAGTWRALRSRRAEVVGAKPCAASAALRARRRVSTRR